MDLAYLRAHPQHLPTFLTHQRIRETPVTGGSICTARRLTLDDGESVFVKSVEGDGGAPPGFFAAEQQGLDWLRAAGAVPVPEVIVALPELLALEWVEPATANPGAAERLGRGLARLHQSGADTFGAPWPGYIGRLPLDNTPSAGPWGGWFAEYRLRPYLRRSVDNGALSVADAARVDTVIDRIDRVAGPAEPPARIHGDLWPGNVLWGYEDAWLIDPAAHGGHRETDLALLALFGGVPHLDRLIDSYLEMWPLGDGWRDRVPLHQLYLVLAHTAMFGAAYRSHALELAGKLG